MSGHHIAQSRLFSCLSALCTQLLLHTVQNTNVLGEKKITCEPNVTSQLTSLMPLTHELSHTAETHMKAEKLSRTVKMMILEVIDYVQK